MGTRFQTIEKGRLMHVDVIIPTRGRPAALEKNVKSILNSTHKDVTIFVVIDGDPSLLPIVAKWPVAVIYNKDRRDWVYSINRGMQYARGDGVLYAVDDLEFPPIMIAELVKAMETHFPGGDGLIGMKQKPTAVQGAIGLMGRKFIDHFPRRHVMCPDFIHFSCDFEIGRYARVNNKFFYVETATLLHHHLRDKTNSLVQQTKLRDRGISSQRRPKEFIWGTTFDLITEGRWADR